MVDLELLKALTPLLIAIIVSGISVAGWYVISKLNRDNEIFKQRLSERLKRRMIMFESVVDAMLPFANPVNGSVDFQNGVVVKSLERARLEVQLYGYDNEVKAFEFFIEALQNQNIHNANQGVREVTTLIRENLRKELDYQRQ